MSILNRQQKSVLITDLDNTLFDWVLDYLFSPHDHEVPPNLNDIRYYEADSYDLKRTKHRFVPANSVKPDASVLNWIVEEIHANKEDCVYVGDSLTKDILMAQDAGVLDVLAEYGIAR